MFQDVAPDPDESYPEGVKKSLKKIGDKIGGAVKSNFDLGIKDIVDSPSRYPVNPKGFTNGCATRMSYCLNYSGVSVPKIQHQTVTGSDHKNYIYRVAIMKTFLSERFGMPDVSEGGSAQRNQFLGKKGIIQFDVKFDDASGHVTLWDGQSAIDEDDFDILAVRNIKLLGARLWICP